MSTTTEIVNAVRSLCYDRFPITVFTIKKSLTSVLNIGNNITFTNPTLNKAVGANDTLQTITDAFINNSTTIPIAYAPRYRYDEPVQNNFIPITSTTANVLENTPVQTKSFFHDNSIKIFLKQYFVIVYQGKTFADDAEMDTYIQTLDARAIRHMSIFTAILLVEYRRFYEYAATSFPGALFSDGSGTALTGQEGSSSDGDTVNINVGGVFSLTDDLDDNQDKSNKDISAVGADNVLEDDGFWYKVWLWLRSLLEREFKDFYFRNDNVIEGSIILERPLDYMAYFGSWPFTSSPYVRNVR